MNIFKMFEGFLEGYKTEGDVITELDNPIQTRTLEINDDYITKNIKWSDVTKSYKAEELKINNNLPEEYEINAILLARKVIQPIFDQFGRRQINSWFRCKTLNKKLGGSSTSQHCTAQAIDLDGYDSNMDVADWIRTNLIFDQLIYESPDSYGDPAWIHVSYKRGHNRKQVLVYSNKKYYNFYNYYDLSEEK